MTFSEAVAARAGQELATVESTLADYGIEAQPTGAAPVPLRLTRLRFAGVKRREGRAEEPFDFERELSTGLWAVTSETVNLAGKSSVLFIIRWALTGRSHLTDDVYAWVGAVELDGLVGEETFSVRFTKEDGELNGELRTGEGVVAPFDGATFEEVMDGFFLDRLRLDPTPFWQKRPAGEADEGDRRRFGWASYFPALHLQADNPTALLGDQTQGGQPGTLMQVFLGLPWALTAASARVAHSQLRMRRSARNRREAEDEAEREQAIAPLQNELAAAQEALAELQATRAPVAPNEADARLAAYAQALEAQRAAEGTLAGARTAKVLTQEDLDDTVKRLQAIEQSHVIRPLLGRLTPTVCPRCSTLITGQRVQREEAEHECSVCAESLDANGEDEQELEGAREAVTRAEEQHTTAEAELAEAEKAHQRAGEALSQAEAAVRELEERRPAEAEARQLETAIARLEGRLEQPQLVNAVGTEELDVAYAIVTAAQEEATNRRGETAAGLLDELGQQISDLGRAFGVENLESAQADLAARLRLRIGDTESWFSDRTGGERLRLRLATVIALLRVGKQLGVGRHPGLLLIDSPGGEEMVEGNVEAIFRELAAVCEEMPGLQVICATARAAEVREVVQAERIIHGTDDGEVW